MELRKVHAPQPQRLPHGRDARDTGRWIIALVLLVIVHPSSFILAASLRTLDGKTYQGQITLEPSGQISVVDLRSEKPIKLDLSNVLEANFGGGGEAPKPRPAAAKTQAAPGAAGQLPA